MFAKETNQETTMKKGILWTMALLMAALFCANLYIGSVDIPGSAVTDILLGKDEVTKRSWQYIVLDSRLPQALTALLCGSALSVSGLMLQTVFRNPLAGPSILGINSGASLGVALVMLLTGGSMMGELFSLSGFIAIVVAAFVGAMVVMGLLLFFSTLLKSDTLLLITGIMIGYVASSAIALLNFFATSEGVHSYMIWGLGSFGGVSMVQMPYFALVTVGGLLCALLLVKPLNALLLGNLYAENLGVNVKHTRFQLLFVTGLLSAITTAFCGPVSFIGLAVPHIARMLLGTSDHRYLLPLTLLTGGAVALLCNLLSVLPGDLGVIPLNAITPLLGAPVIIYVLMHRGKK